MASDAIALESLKFLRSDEFFGKLACVVSNPDKPKGRGHKLSPNPVSEWALANFIPLLRPEKRPGLEEIECMKALGVDCVIVMAYGHILRADVLDFPQYGCLNLHASLLPELRGPSPIETAIACGETQTGVCLMRMALKMDVGGVCAKKHTDISPRETSASLREKISVMSAFLLRESLPKVAEGSAVFEEQDESRASYTRKLDKFDLFLDFGKDAVELDRRIRAFGQGAFEYDGEVIKTHSAFACAPDEKCGECGEILESSNRDSLDIACKRGYIKISSLQKPCAKMLPASEFFKSHKFDAKKIIASALNAPLLK